MTRKLILILLLLPLTGCYTHLMTAVKRDKPETVKMLLDQGADVNETGKWGMSPLILAVGRRRPAITRILLERGANIEQKTSSTHGHYTALMWAALTGNLDAVRVLLNSGADVKATNKAGLTTEQIAMRFKQPEAVRIIWEFTRRASPVHTIAHRPQSARTPTQQSRNIDIGVDQPTYKLAERTQDFALVIGIEKYSELPDAKFAEKDADAVKNHLISLGFPRRNVIHLAGSKAGRAGIEKYLEDWVPRNIKRDSRFFFYFSGHGAPDAQTGDAYLVPWDGDANFLKRTGYPLKRLYAKLQALKAKEVIVVLDACFSGAGGRSVLAEGVRPLVTKVNLGKAPGGKVTVFTAAAANEITSTLKDKGHGMFTYFFLKGLNGAAKDAKGRITSKSLYKYLKPHVQDEARRQNREQTPSLHTSSNPVFRVL